MKGYIMSEENKKIKRKEKSFILIADMRHGQLLKFGQINLKM